MIYRTFLNIPLNNDNLVLRNTVCYNCENKKLKKVTAMKICKNCQIEFDESHNFCSSCGSKLEKLVTYETSRAEYFINPSLGGRIFENFGNRGTHFKRFLFNNDHYYINKGKIWKEDIISGNRSLIAELDNYYQIEVNNIDDLFLFINNDGIIVYSLGLEYLYYFPHNETSGKNYCQLITKKDTQSVGSIYISDNLIFYTLENYENEEIDLDEQFEYYGYLPQLMPKNNSSIEKFDILTGQNETIFSSIYLGEVYIDPVSFMTSIPICGNKDYLVFPISIYNVAGEEEIDYTKPKEVIVLLNMNTKEMQMLQTETLEREFLFFDAQRNQIWYRKENTDNNFYQKYDIISDTTEEYKFDSNSSITYFDGIEAFECDQYSIHRLYKDGSKSENLRTDSNSNLRDASFFKTDKWLMILGEGNPGITEEYLYFEKDANNPTYKSVFDFEEQL